MSCLETNTLKPMVTLRIAVVTTFFPNAIAPQRTMFVRNLVSSMRSSCEVLEVVAPLPYAPPFTANRRWRDLRSVPDHEVVDELKVSHPRFVAVPGLQVLNGLTYGVRVLFELWRLKRERGDFVVHGHCAYPDGVGVALASRLLRLPYAITAHGSDLNVYAQRRALRPQISWALRGATGIVAVSAALQSRVFELLTGKVHCRQTAHIPCAGFDPNIFVPPAERKQDLSEGRIVIFVGHLVPIKGIPFLIQAWLQLSAEGKVTARDRLLIVGDGPERASLEALAQSTTETAPIEFTGALAPREVATRLAAARLLCLPSLNEGTPNVIVEALASGIPVVASRVGGIPDLVQPGVNGFLTAPGDVGQLADALTIVLERTWSREEVRRSVLHLTWDELARRNVNFLTEAISTSA